MSLPKNKVIPGTITLITDITNDDKLFSNKMPVILSKKPADTLNTCVIPQLNEELVILSKPKKYDSINCVKVKYKNEEYYAYYCSIRYMTTEK